MVKATAGAEDGFSPSFDVSSSISVGIVQKGLKKKTQAQLFQKVVIDHNETTPKSCRGEEKCILRMSRKGYIARLDTLRIWILLKHPINHLRLVIGPWYLPFAYHSQNRNDCEVALEDAKHVIVHITSFLHLCLIYMDATDEMSRWTRVRKRG